MDAISFIMFGWGICLGATFLVYFIWIQWKKLKPIIEASNRDYDRKDYWERKR
jgi:hypothetical protein